MDNAIICCIASVLGMMFSFAFSAEDVNKEPTNEGSSARLKQLADDDADIRLKAASELIADRPIANESIPVLIRLLRDRDVRVREKARDGLVGMSNSAVVALANTLTDSDAFLRFQSADVLSRIGPVAREAIPALLVAIADKDDLVRHYSSQALFALSIERMPLLEKEESISTIIKAFNDAQPSVRINCRTTLRNVGKPAVTKLLKALESEADVVRQEAANTLGSIGADASEALPALKLLLEDKHKNVRDAASAAIVLIKTFILKLDNEKVVPAK